MGARCARAAPPSLNAMLLKSELIIAIVKRFSDYHEIAVYLGGQTMKWRNFSLMFFGLIVLAMTTLLSGLSQ